MCMKPCKDETSHPGHQTNVLRAYRELLSLVKRLPIDKRQQALKQAREEAKANSGISDAIEASDKLKQLFARISYLRTITPRQPGDSGRVGAGRFVLRDGELVPSTAQPQSRVADGTMSMEEARQRHKTLLRRQHFGRDPGPMEPF